MGRLGGRPNQDVPSQIAQVPGDADCFFGNIGEINWPPVLTAAKKLGKKLRFYGPQGNLDAKVAKDYPAETEGAVIIGVYPDITAPVFDDYRAALDKYRRSRTDRSTGTPSVAWARGRRTWRSPTSSAK
jgi:hypothetical protein